MKNEPAISIGAVGSLVAAVIAVAVSFGVHVSDNQTQAVLKLVAAVGVILPLVTASLIRPHVTPSAKAEASGRGILAQILALLEQIWAWLQSQPAPVPPVPTPVPPVPPVPTPVPPTPTPSPVQTVVWFNQSQGLVTDAQLASIVEALNAQGADVVALWGKSYTDRHVVGTDPAAPLPDGVWPAYLITSDAEAAQGALAFHSVDPWGRPYSRVECKVILDNGGSVLTGANSISSAASHEACEMSVDPPCTLTVTDPQGRVWAEEVCDPGESSAYDIMIADGTKVAVSDLVGPAFFGVAGGPLDKTGAVTAPFTIAPGGYAVINGSPVFGKEFPAWKVPGKLRGAARTARRLAAEQAKSAR